jgi:hypothetical protein
VSHVVVDFDYRIGGTVGAAAAHADGIGFSLLNTADYGVSGPGTAITEEATGVATRDSSIGIGLDTWDNDGNGIPDPDNNHISLHYTSSTTSVSYAVSLTPFGYQLHKEPGFNDSGTAFDHLHMLVDIGNHGATITVAVTPAGGTSFTPIYGLLIPFVSPYEMRAGFGARTGVSSDNHDIANIAIGFTR